FDLEAVEWVCSENRIDHGGVWELLTSLVDKSLVEVDTARGGIRYGLLEAMRDYGREHLRAAPDATIALRNRHLEHYLMVADSSDRLFTGRAGREVGARLTADSENFDAALNTSVELGRTESGQRLALALADFWRA